MHTAPLPRRLPVPSIFLLCCDFLLDRGEKLLDREGKITTEKKIFSADQKKRRKEERKKNAHHRRQSLNRGEIAKQRRKNSSA